MPERDLSRNGELAIVAVVTVAGLVLRLAGIDQSLWGDEETLYNVVHGVGLGVDHGDGLGAVLAAIRATEKTPPLHFVLAWGAAQLGDPTVWTRLPSLLLGTAAIPLVYLLGVRTVGRRAGIVAAALMAFAPFAIHYSIENRAYATLTFFSVLSTLALLTALRRGGFLSWLAFAASTAAVVYTHYTGVFVVFGQLAWALWAHRGHARPLAIAYAAAALAYVPWLSSFFIQLDHSSLETRRLAEEFPLTAGKLADMFTGVLPGHLPSPPDHSSGLPWDSILWATIGLSLLILAVGYLRQPGRRLARTSPTVVLVVVLALVTPVGVICYSLQPDTSLLLPRNLSASLPALALVVGSLTTSLRPSMAIAAVGVVLASVVFGAARTLDHDHRRPPFRDVAHFIDKVAGPDDAVITNTPSYLRLYLEREHSLFHETDPRGWERVAAGGRAYLVRLEFVRNSIPHLAGPDNRVPLRGERRFAGRWPLGVGRYSGRLKGELEQRDGRVVIAQSPGQDIALSPGAARGFVDSAKLSGPRLEVHGWATDAAGREVAGRVLAFSGGQLRAVGLPNEVRPDVAKAYGSQVARSGYTLTLRTTPGEKLVGPSGLRLFAVAGSRAAELKLSAGARQALRAGSS